MQSPELLKLFAESVLNTSEKVYTFISIPVSYWQDVLMLVPANEFLSITKDREDEISMIVETDIWESIDTSSLEFISSDGWKLFSLYGEGLMDAAGYLAKICLLLAQNDITLMAFSTFKKSHLLVKDGDYKKAQAILKIFLSQP